MIKPIKPSKHFFNNKAQTMVEFALVFPLVLIITYGLIEFGRMLFIYTAVTGAAREGARYGATAANYKNCGGIRQAAISKAFLVAPSDVSVAISYTHAGSTPTCGASYSGQDLVLGDRITVRVTANFSTIIPLPGIPDSINIIRQSTRTLVLGVDIAPP